MNKCVIIGNLTRDPENRVTGSGIGVCTFTVAVNRRVKSGEEQKADFFRVTAWRQLGEICGKYLARGRKVAVEGPVSVSTYEGRDGKTYANLEITAENVEFLSAKGESGYTGDAGNDDQQAPAATSVPVEVDDLPF